MKKRIVSVCLALALVLSLIVPIAGCSKAATGFTVNSEGFATSYVVGAEIDYSPISITVRYDDGSEEVIAYADFEAKGVKFSGIDTAKAGEKNISITFAGKTQLIKVNVTAEAEAVTIELNDNFPREYAFGSTVDYTKIQLVVEYNDGTNTVVDAAKDTGITHTSIDTAKAGEQDFTVSYAGLSTTVKVTVAEPVTVTSVAIKEGTFAAEFETENDVNYNTIRLIVKYSDGSTKEIGVNEQGVRIQRPVITEAGEYTVTITYGGKQTSATFTVKTALTDIVTDVELTAGVTRYKQGDAVDYSKFTVKVTYAEGDPYEAKLSEADARVVYTPIDTDAKQDAPVAFTVSVSGVQSDAVSITVAYVKTVAVENLETQYTAGEPFDPSCTVVLTYSDGQKEEVTQNSTGITYTPVDTSAVGEKTFTVTYTLTVGGEVLNTVISAESKITIAALETLTMFSAPDLWTNYETNRTKQGFKITDEPYVVGDENPFILLPRATGEDEGVILTEVRTVASFKMQNDQGVFEAVADPSQYVDVDSSKNYYNFTEAAVGKTFEITVTPDKNIYAIDETAGSATFTVTVTVQSGYNVYNAQGLAAFDNRTGSGWDAVKPTIALEWDGKPLSDFSPSAIMLHSMSAEGITVTKADLPESFFYDEADSDYQTTYNALADWKYQGESGAQDGDLMREHLDGSLREGEAFPAGSVESSSQIALYEHQKEAATIYGNYATVRAGDELKVVFDRQIVSENGRGGVSEPHISMFGFCISKTDENAGANLLNVQLIGNTRREESNGPQGIMMLHNSTDGLNIRNVVATQFFTNIITDRSPDGKLTLDSVSFTDSYSNMLYNWSNAEIVIKDSVLKNAGGPLLLNVDHDYDSAQNPDQTPLSTVIENSELENWVAGTEMWFQINTATTYAATIKAMAAKLSNKSYQYTNSAGFINLIAAQICDPGDLAGIDGTIYTTFKITDAAKNEEQTFDTNGTILQKLITAVHSQYSMYAPLVQCGTAWGAFQPTSSDMTSFAFVDLATSLGALGVPAGAMSAQTAQYAGLYLPVTQAPGYIGVVLKGIAKS